MKANFGDKDLELALLVDPSNKAILSNSRLETSADGEHWVGEAYVWFRETPDVCGSTKRRVGRRAPWPRAVCC
jgi:hypothetical protein